MYSYSLFSDRLYTNSLNVLQRELHAVQFKRNLLELNLSAWDSLRKVENEVDRFRENEKNASELLALQVPEVPEDRSNSDAIGSTGKSGCKQHFATRG